MAVGNITGYEPGPIPGSYNFATKDGRKFAFSGVQAEDLKRKLDQASAIGPQPMAGTNPYGTTPPPKVDFAFGANPPPTPGAPPPSRADVAPKMTGAAPAAPATPTPTPPATQSTDLGLGYRMGPNGKIQEFTPGSPGSPGGPTERSRTIHKPGYETDNEQAEAYQDANFEILNQRMAGVEEARQRQAQAFEEEQALLQDQRVLQNDAYNEELKQKADIDLGVKKAEAEREAAVKEYTASKNFDPMKRALSGGKNWIFGLSAGLGAFASTIMKSPNYALEVVHGLIDKDIAAQEKEIQIKGDAANNALADLTRKLGSQERAKIALAQIQGQLFQNSLAQHASRSKDAEYQTRSKELILGLQKDYLDKNEQDRRIAAGEVTMNVVNQPAQAARAPGWRDVGDQLGTYKQLQGLSGGGAQGGSSALTTKLLEPLALDSQIIEQSVEAEAALPAGDGEKWDPTGVTRYLPGGMDKGSANKLDEATGDLATSVEKAGGNLDTGGAVAPRRRQIAGERAEAARRMAIRISTLLPEQQAQVLGAMPPATRTAVAKALEEGRAKPAPQAPPGGAPK